jgi:tRNA A-37 threonylcarbamoyl transferase component Bud32
LATTRLGLTCDSCGVSVPPDAGQCPGCGTPLRPAGVAERRSGGLWRRWAALLDVGVEVAPRDPAESAPRLRREALDAGADPGAVRAHAFTLRFFSSELEAEFKEEYQRQSLRLIRVAVALGLFLVAAFGLLDAIIQTPVRNELWLIRYGILVPLIAVVQVLTFSAGAFRFIEWVLAAMVLVIGAGILAMISIAPPPGRYFYYAGLILVIMYNFAALKLRFAIASMTGWAIVALYIAVELVVGETPWPILTNNLFFLVSAAVIGMMAAYFLETLARRNFVQGRFVRQAREFGSYRLVAPLGRGGMGEVWRANHRLLARPAAIKLIRPELFGASGIEGRRATLRRFEREAQATALLRSPHTIQLYDFGVTDEGTFYYVMELLDGFDLETLVQRFGPLPWQRAIHLLRQVCDSLGEAHEHGMIHRDIKPANIYVCRYGRASDYVKVLDFGLVESRREGEDELGEPRVTKEGRFAGTPSCMAPEQIDARPLDARTDVYALGCVAYWLLTGKEVFEGTGLRVMLHHVQTPPTPPSARTDRAIPQALESIVLACLAKSPDDRPQAVDALARQLASCVEGEPWTQDLAQTWWGEHGGPAVAEAWVGEPRRVMPSVIGPW